MKDGSLTIGVTTFNRCELLRAFARSLAQVRNLHRVRLLVLDDCSDEFDLEFLKALFPAATVVRHETNSGGPDQAMQRLFERFVRDGSGYLLNLDSDLLASRNLVDRCLQIITKDRRLAASSLYSLFNAPSHRPIRLEGEFVLKETVGAAGTLWEHELLADVLLHVPVSRKFDWDWSAYLGRRGVPILVTAASYLQHIGRVGQHSRSLVGMDHGQAFDDYRDQNLSCFLDHTREGLLQMLGEQHKRLEQQQQAIIQLAEVVQSQARLVSEIVRQIPAAQATPAESG